MLTDNGPVRISDISPKAKQCIDNCLSYTFDRYIHMDFNFGEKGKVLRMQ